MNNEHLQRNVGHVVKLMPPAHHLNAAGEVEGCPNEDWTIVSVERNRITVRSDAGHTTVLASDHVRNYTSDPKTSSEGTAPRGHLTLLVQLFIGNGEVSAVPAPYPGAGVLPRIDRSRKARTFFAPEFQRAMAKQIAILDRIAANYSQTALGRDSCPGDTWTSLMPHGTEGLTDSAMFHDLSLGDAELLAEFNASLREVTRILENWTATSVMLSEYNAWNVLMHKVQHSLRTGMLAAQRFCPESPYDATMPASGKLVSRAERALSQTDQLRASFIARHTTSPA
jgi:hypothetical protein